MTRSDISPRLPYRLYLRRHNGYKFKKGFKTESEAMWFVEPYLRLCCLPCKAMGIIQKVSDIGGIRDGYSNFPHSHKRLEFFSGQREKEGRCMMCQTPHECYYDGHIKRVRIRVDSNSVRNQDKLYDDAKLTVSFLSDLEDNER